MSAKSQVNLRRRHLQQWTCYMSITSSLKKCSARWRTLAWLFIRSKGKATHWPQVTHAAEPRLVGMAGTDTLATGHPCSGAQTSWDSWEKIGHFRISCSKIFWNSWHERLYWYLLLFPFNARPLKAILVWENSVDTQLWNGGRGETFLSNLSYTSGVDCRSFSIIPCIDFDKTG